MVLLKVSPWKGVIQFKKMGKIGPRYINPFRVLSGVGQVAYLLDLPGVLSQIHCMLYISHLRKCLVEDSTLVLLVDTQVDGRLNYIERLIAILDRKTKTLHNKVSKSGECAIAEP